MSNTVFLRVIGDCHGCINTKHPYRQTSYRNIISDCKYSVQLGDMGFNYTGLEGVDSNHMFIPGNHDNYDNLPPQALTGWGTAYINACWEFFYVRGAWSIDIEQRKQMMREGKSKKIWWHEEELSTQEMEDAFKAYKHYKPEVMLTHSCPISISEYVGSKNVWKLFGWNKKQESRTQLLLEYMLQTHQPKLWLFGHFHRNWDKVIGDTKFMCVDELCYVDFDENWSIIT